MAQGALIRQTEPVSEIVVIELHSCICNTFFVLPERVCNAAVSVAAAADCIFLFFHALWKVFSPVSSKARNLIAQNALDPRSMTFTTAATSKENAARNLFHQRHHNCCRRFPTATYVSFGASFVFASFAVELYVSVMACKVR